MREPTPEKLSSDLHVCIHAHRHAHACDNSMKKMCVGSREVTILQGGGWQAKQKIRESWCFEESSYSGRSAESQPRSFLIPEAALGERRLALI